MIKVSHLTKKYGKKKVIDDISFTVDDGEIIGFLGPNGAGKSTTLNIITGCISSTSGTVEVDGYNIIEKPIEVKKRIGYLPEQPPLYLDMNVIDYLKFVYDLKKINNKDKATHIQDIINEVGINEVKQRRIGNLSKGYKQRVGFAGALIGDPQTLILDEPTVGFDPKQMIEMRNLIKTLGANRTVILSSHILSEISMVCDRVMIINSGRLVAEDTPQNLSDRFGRDGKLLIRVVCEPEDAANVLENIAGITAFQLKKNKDGSCDVEIETDGEFDIEFGKTMFFAFAQQGIAIIMQKRAENSLEDIFLRITADDTDSAEEENTDESNNKA